MEFRALVGSLQLTKMEILYIQMDLQKLKIAKTLETFRPIQDTMRLVV